MWRLTLIFNTLLMGVFCLPSAIGMVAYGNLMFAFLDSKPLPPLIQFALDNLWIYAVLPVLWILGLAFFLWRFRKVGLSAEAVQLHTSATLFIGGFFVMVFLCVTGILPLISLTMCLCR